MEVRSSILWLTLAGAGIHRKAEILVRPSCLCTWIEEIAGTPNFRTLLPVYIDNFFESSMPYTVLGCVPSLVTKPPGYLLIENDSFLSTEVIQVLVFRV